MPFVKIWIHLVWTTKNRIALLPKSIRPAVFAHIQENARDKEIFLSDIGGSKEHVHLLISLSPRQNLAKIVQLLKGEVSFWINNEKLVPGKFEWQDDYYAASISEGELERVKKYIQNQEEHHRVKTFTEEYQKFISGEVTQWISD